METSLLPTNQSWPFSDRMENTSREGFHKEKWVIKLHSYLLTLNKSVSPHVNMVFGDYEHYKILLNWITAALNVIKPPLHNILVLSLDNELCDYLVEKKLPVECISLKGTSFFTKTSWYAHMRIRNIVLWMINYWGYDVAS